MRLLISIISLAVLAIGFYFGHKAYEEMPKKILTLGGIFIGDPEAKVLVSYGKPSSESETEVREKVFYKTAFYTEYLALGPAARIFKYKGKDESSLLVEQICIAGFWPHYDQWPVNRIGIGSSLKSLLDRLGEPTSIDIRSDKLAAMYSYSQYNLFFEIEKGSVAYYCVTDGGNYVYTN